MQRADAGQHLGSLALSFLLSPGIGLQDQVALRQNSLTLIDWGGSDETGSCYVFVQETVLKA